MALENKIWRIGISAGVLAELKVRWMIAVKSNINSAMEFKPSIVYCLWQAKEAAVNDKPGNPF